MPLFRRPFRASGDAVNTSMLELELAPLNTQVEQIEQKREALESELRVVEQSSKRFPPIDSGSMPCKLSAMHSTSWGN